MHFPSSFLVGFFFLCILLIEKPSQKPPFIHELQSKKHLQTDILCKAQQKGYTENEKLLPEEHE